MKVAALRTLFPSVDPKAIETALYNSREHLDDAYLSLSLSLLRCIRLLMLLLHLVVFPFLSETTRSA
jgi:hypothetical protein